jgi:hypothetical protein
LSRRLGEDPLTRARKKKGSAKTMSSTSLPPATNPSIPSVTVTPDTTSPVDVPQVSTRASYNDVFFQRKSPVDDAAVAAVNPEPITTAEEARASSSTEISEINEIPEIRELATTTTAMTDVHPPTTGLANAAITAVDATPSTLNEVALSASSVHSIAPSIEHHPDNTVAIVARKDEPPSPEVSSSAVAVAATTTTSIQSQVAEEVTIHAEANHDVPTSIPSTTTQSPSSDSQEKEQEAPTHQKGGFLKRLLGRFGGK